MDARALDLIGDHCLKAHRLARKQGDKLLSYFLGMALIAARDAKRQEEGGRARPLERRRARK